MNTGSARESKGGSPLKRLGLLLAFALVLYGILYAIAPDKALMALKASAKVLLSVCIPLALVFVVMFLSNLFVRPAQIAGLLGKGTGMKAIVLSIAAGIISVGPIFAWYPLMKKLKQEGAGDGPMAVFLYNRAIKLFLLPVMITYFGWPYVVILTMLTILGSIVLGYFMKIMARD